MANQKSPHAWEVVANQNDDADASVLRPEGMSAKRVNDMDRAEMAAHKAHLIDSSYGTLTTGAGPASYVLALEQVITGLKPGMRFALTAHSNNNGPSTLNIGTGAIEWLRHDGRQLKAGDIVEDRYYQVVVDDNGSFRNIHPSQSEQPPATIVFLETTTEMEIVGTNLAAASDEYDYTRVFKDSKTLVTVTGQYTGFGKDNKENNRHEIQLMYIDSEGDELPLVPATPLLVGHRGPFETGINPLTQGSFCLQAILDDSNMRNSDSWRVILYAGTLDNDQDKIQINWSTCTFTPTM